MFLVYEKNYLCYGYHDCIEESELKLFSSKKLALTYMEERKQYYIQDIANDFTFMPEESNLSCLVFADELDGENRAGEFHICLTELEVDDFFKKFKSCSNCCYLGEVNGKFYCNFGDSENYNKEVTSYNYCDDFEF